MCVLLYAYVIILLDISESTSNLSLRAIRLKVNVLIMKTIRTTRRL